MYSLADIGQNHHNRAWNGVPGIGLMGHMAIRGQQATGANMVKVIMESTVVMETVGNI